MVICCPYRQWRTPARRLRGEYVWRAVKRMLDSQKQQWAQEHARRIQKRFEQWQQPLGINGQDYLEYLSVELRRCCDDPLLKELIESLS